MGRSSRVRDKQERGLSENLCSLEHEPRDSEVNLPDPCHPLVTPVEERKAVVPDKVRHEYVPIFKRPERRERERHALYVGVGDYLVPMDPEFLV